MPAASCSTTRSTEPVRDAVFAAVQRDKLADAVSAMGRLAQSPDDRAREQVLSRYRWVRRYLPALLETITFCANDAGEPISTRSPRCGRPPGGRTRTPDLFPTRVRVEAWRARVEPAPVRSIGVRTRCARWRACVTRSAAAMSTSPPASATPTRVRVCSGTRRWPPRARTRSGRSRCPRARAVPRTARWRARRRLPAHARRADPEHPIHDTRRGGAACRAARRAARARYLVDLRERVDALMPAADLPGTRARDRRQDWLDRWLHQRPETRRAARRSRHKLCAVLVAQACNVGYSHWSTRATPHCAKHGCATSPSATCPPRRSPPRTPGSSTFTPRCRWPSAGAAVRSRRSTGCGSSCRAARFTLPITAAIRSAPRRHAAGHDRRPLRRPAHRRHHRHPARRPVHLGWPA